MELASIVAVVCAAAAAAAVVSILRGAVSDSSDANLGLNSAMSDVKADQVVVEKANRRLLVLSQGKVIKSYRVGERNVASVN